MTSDIQRGPRPPAAAGTRGGAHPPFEAALRALFRLALDQLEAERDLPRRRDRPASILREELGLALGPEGVPFEAVLDKLRRILAETPSAAGPRFFNQLFGGRDPIATVAEMLTPLTNTSMYTYKVAGPQVLVEQEVLGRMGRLAGYDEGEGALFPGGSLANLTALLLARNEAGEEVRERGLNGERWTVYTSADGHYSTRKNAGILGLGREAVREIPTDSEGRLDRAALEATLREDRAAGLRPLLINATAGTTVLGAFDAIRPLAAAAREHGAWLHVDGALGGSVLLCSDHRHLLDGLELADSFTWNAHKMMGVPLSCSALLLRRPGLLAKHLGESADYLFQSEEDSLNPGRRSLQCGRRNDALKLWAAWQLHGDRGYDERLTRLFELARYAARAIAADPDLELVMPPPSINVCFRVRGRSSEQICALLEQEGRLLIGHGRVGSARAIRLVCVNPELTEADIDRVLEEIRLAASRLSDDSGPATD